MSTTYGPNNCNTGTGTAWTNPSNITGASAFATKIISNSSSTNPLIGTGFGFSVPSDEAILGVTASLIRKASNSTYIETSSIQLVNARAVIGTATGGTAKWTITATTETWGGASSMWGAALTPAIVNSSTFGFQIIATNTDSVNSETASVQDYLITVYTATAAGNPPGSLCLLGCGNA